MAAVEQSTSLASDSTFAAFDAALAGARQSFEAGLDRMRSVPDSLLVRELDRLEQRVAAERLLAVARLAGSSGDVGIDRRRARSTMSDTSQSGRSVNRDARRAAIVAANDRLGEQLANGSIAPDSIDALVKAADDASGRLPEELVDAVEGLAADQAGRVVQDHLEAVADASEVEDRYQRQYESRRSYRYNSPAINGRPALSGIAIEGADADVDRLWSMIRSRADAAYTAAGGRDAPKTSHRSFEQRLFDSLDEALAGNSSGVTGGRPAVIVTVNANDLVDDPEGDVVASQLGTGPIPKTLLDRYVGTGSLMTMVANADGAPLWFGRSRRNSSEAQFLALAVRDRGCVLCRAGVDRCQAHHIMPWTSPGRGRTDIDQLALLCQQCHRDLHHRNHTLYQRRSKAGVRVWATRPATPQETPAPKPAYCQRE